jgi:hypothetical protein
VSESPSLPQRKKRDVWLTPLVVQFSGSCRRAAPHLPHAPVQPVPSGRTDAPCPPIGPKDDIVGWPVEMPIELPDFTDYPLDSRASCYTTACGRVSSSLQNVCISRLPGVGAG